MDWYNALGTINSVCFVVSLYGLYHQWTLLRTRRSSPERTAPPSGVATQGLSLDRFVAAFIGSYAFFFYGTVLAKFNGYLVFPRFLAVVLVVLIVREIVQDRADGPSRGILRVGYLLTLLGVVMMVLHHPLPRVEQSWKWVIVAVTGVMGYGLAAQCWVLWTRGRTKAMSLVMEVLFELKDLTTIAFALAMGFTSGWPILVMGLVNSLLRVPILVYLGKARIRSRHSAAAVTGGQP